MNKRDIVNKLKADQKAGAWLLEGMFASDLKIKLESKLEYINILLEWIEQEGKV